MMKAQLRKFKCPVGENAVIAGYEFKALFDQLNIMNGTAVIISEEYGELIDTAEGTIRLVEITYVMIPDDLIVTLFSQIISKKMDQFATFATATGV